MVDIKVTLRGNQELRLTRVVSCVIKWDIKRPPLVEQKASVKRINDSNVCGLVKAQKN